MKRVSFQSASSFIISVIFALTTQLCADVPEAYDSRGAARNILSNWFSISPDEVPDVRLQSASVDSIGATHHIRFLSDDGEAVNGVIAYPPANVRPSKLALLMHPMGSDLSVWWKADSRIGGRKISDALRRSGHVVISLDARKHGARRQKGFGPKQLLQNARSATPRLYLETIIGSVRDYRQLLLWADAKLKLTDNTVFVGGYSMGAQMSILLAANEPRVNKVLAIVPPYVDAVNSPVAPRYHIGGVQAELMLLLANQDPYSSLEQNLQLVNAAEETAKPVVHYYESGHLLPQRYLDDAIRFIQRENSEVQK